MGAAGACALRCRLRVLARRLGARMNALVRLDDVTLGYGRRPAVHHIEGSVNAGDLLAIAGPNGAGKTTLLKGLAGIIKPLEGQIARGDLKRGDIAYLPQLAELDREFPIDVWGFVALGIYARIGPFAAATRTHREAIGDAIASVSLGGFENRPVASLSGGQLQRALFARTLVQEARLVLLDEPLNAVDARTAQRLIEIIRGWRTQGRAVVAVLHDHDLIRAHFPDTLVLAREQIAWGPTPASLSTDNLLRARVMVEAWKNDAKACERERAA